MSPDEFARRISHEMKFIIKWVERRLAKVVPKREGVHDHSAMLIFSGWDQVQYVSNVHRDDAAQLMIDLLKRWNKMGPIKTDIPFYAKTDIVDDFQLHTALKEEICNLFAEMAVRGRPNEAVLLLLEEVSIHVIRGASKQGHRTRVADFLAREISRTLLAEDREYKRQHPKTSE